MKTLAIWVMAFAACLLLLGLMGASFAFMDWLMEKKVSPQLIALIGAGLIASFITLLWKKL